MNSYIIISRKLIALIAFVFVIGVANAGKDPRIQEELDAESPAPIPLVNTIGEDEVNEAIASGKYWYVGNSKCRLCHRDFFLGRKQDAHDYALKKISKSEYADNPRCLICHSTGFGIETGFVSMEKTPRLANVQCEGCHGPGSEHVRIRDKGGFLAGPDRPERIKRMCRSCHNERWNKAFDDFDATYEKYKNPVPD
jgi:hypothetical protein